MDLPLGLVSVAGPKVLGPVVVAVMDGVGLGAKDAGDAVAQARTPVLDALARGPIAMALRAHGPAVGLASDADMGNSEVGHNALGAGRVFDQGAKRVAEAVASGAVFDAPIWGKMMARCHQGRTLHLVGLLSDGNIHSHIDHLFAVLQKAAAAGVQSVCIHALLDGRDVPKTSAHLFVARLEALLATINQTPGRSFRIASGGGRMQITMDRYDADWAMVARGWQTHVRGEGRQFASAADAIATLRAEDPGLGDQDLPAFVVAHRMQPVGVVHDGDCMIALNFRGDRMLEWVRAMEDDTFTAFDRGVRPDVMFCGMTLYDGDTSRPKNYLVPPPIITHTLGELMAQGGITQLACSETQKFGHVTYFWNGNRSGAFDAATESYIEVPSLAVPFAKQPAMRAQSIVQTVCATLAQHNQQFTRLNLANGDMVGHTGDFAATVLAIEAVDKALGTLHTFIAERQGALIVTADHGNAEDMGERATPNGPLLVGPDGGLVPKTRHSLNPVPFYIALPRPLATLLRPAQTGPTQAMPTLTHVAATCCTLMGLKAPAGHFDPSLVAWSAP